MSASSEIRFRIGADTSALSRGFAQAQSVAAVAGKQIHKKLGLQDAFKSGVLALGLSVEKLSEKLTEMFTGGAQESWKSALEAAKEAERIIEESTLKRMSTLRQIEKLEKDIRRNAAEENATPRKQNLPGWLQGMIGGLSGSGLVGAGIGALVKKHFGEESQADATDRSQKATAERLAKEQKIDELKEKQSRDQARVDAAFLDVVRLSLTEQEKALELQQEMEAAEKTMLEAQRKHVDSTEQEIDFLHKKKALEEQLLKIEQQQTQEDEKKKHLREAFIEKYRHYLDAQQGVKDAHQGIADARHDLIAGTLDETAAGKRGKPSDRARARRILADEATARRLLDSGNKVTLFDQKTQRNVNVGAEYFQNRAADARLREGKLKKSEQNQLSPEAKLLYESKKVLENIERDLRPTDTE